MSFTLNDWHGKWIVEVPYQNMVFCSKNNRFCFIEPQQAFEKNKKNPICSNKVEKIILM
jgi:hypothetical protein